MAVGEVRPREEKPKEQDEPSSSTRVEPSTTPQEQEQAQDQVHEQVDEQAQENVQDQAQVQNDEQSNEQDQVTQEGGEAQHPPSEDQSVDDERVERPIQ